ncbi:2-acylglycerol O-acyltransferase 2-A-like isoform X2 [Petromyzon marinus]|uniref:2-acylglycerol O-acyltransferase 2-A-like isoform X2 n=1 Tax=Petromyzon marinus TaxID=7757 RepID=UPI003F71617E
MKVKFAPLVVPLARRLQTFAVLQWVFSFLALGQVCLAALLLLPLLLPPLRLLALAYLLWLYLDWETPQSGGRRSRWLVKTAELDPDHNYLFGFHPHGVLVAGGFGNFGTEATGFRVLFPGLRPHLLMLPFWFRIPFFREYIMAGGLVPSDMRSATTVLSRQGGGNVAVLAVGGAPEALDARPGAHTLQVRRRKGFIKLALTTGAQLVPVFSFGENELFQQVGNPRGSWLRAAQERLQGLMGVALPLFHARGVFQYSFGLLPYRTAIHTVVGEPIAVELTPSPSADDITRLHEHYLERLTALFEKHKETYGVPADKQLTFY